MAAIPGVPLDAQIALVEKRMALRRERIAGNLEETRVEASRAIGNATRWLPVAGAAGALVVGFMVARHRRAAERVSPASFRSPAPAPVAPAAKGALATIIALAAGAIRFATSTEGRMAWRAFQTARAHAQRRRA